MPKKPRHPTQPIAPDSSKADRFKPNGIIEWLFQQGRLDLNELRRLPFDREDRIQLAQLWGCSVCYLSDAFELSNKEWNRINEEGRRWKTMKKGKKASDA